MDSRYQGELPRRTWFDRLSQGRRLVFGIMMVVSLVGATFGVRGGLAARLAPAMLVLFIGGISWTFLSFREERRLILERELLRVRESFGQEVKRLYETVAKEWVNLAVKSVRDVRKQWIREVDQLVRSSGMSKSRCRSRSSKSPSPCRCEPPTRCDNVSCGQDSSPAFRATVVRNESGQLSILAEQSDSRWSGRALDDSLAHLVAEQFLDEHSFDPRTDPAASAMLLRQAEALKIKLLAQPFGTERVTFFLGGRVTELLLFESDILQLVEPMLTCTLDVTEQALRAAGLTWQSVDRVVLSGELSAVPLQQPRTNPAVEVIIEWSAAGSITVIARDAENGQQTAWTFETAAPDNDERWPVQQARRKRTPLRD